MTFNCFCHIPIISVDKNITLKSNYIIQTSDLKCGRTATKRLHWKGFGVGRTAFSPRYRTQFPHLSDFSRSRPKPQSRLKPHFKSLIQTSLHILMILERFQLPTPLLWPESNARRYLESVPRDLAYYHFHKLHQLQDKS